MTVQTIRITDRETWLRWRESDVTASVCGALLGVHDWMTPYGLYALKSGLLREDPEESAPMRRGRLLEPVAMKLLREERPEWRVEEPGVYLRDPAIRLGATPDCYVTCPERGPGVVQFKSVEQGVFRRKWHGADGEIEPPLWIAVQALVEAHLSGRRWAAVAPLVVGFGIDLPIIEIPLHPGLIARIRAEVVAFWAMIERGDAPSPDYGRDGEVIAQMYRDDDGTEADLRAENHLPVLCAERDELRGQIKAATARTDEIDAELKEKLGPHASAVLADGRRITWKTQHRRGGFTAPSTSRVLRVGDAPRVETFTSF